MVKTLNSGILKTYWLCLISSIDQSRNLRHLPLLSLDFQAVMFFWWNKTSCSRACTLHAYMLIHCMLIDVHPLIGTWIVGFELFTWVSINHLWLNFTAGNTYRLILNPSADMTFLLQLLLLSDIFAGRQSKRKSLPSIMSPLRLSFTRVSQRVFWLYRSGDIYIYRNSNMYSLCQRTGKLS